MQKQNKIFFTSKKLLLIGLISISSSLFADTSIGVRIQAPVGNGVVDVGFRNDDHRYDNRYRNFDYNRYGYFDDFGYYFGYFDRTGYFFNNIFFLYDNHYTYYDRLHRRGYFKPTHVHFRKYKYDTRGNNWNKERQYRQNNQKVYGHYYDKNQNYMKNNSKNYNNRNSNQNNSNKNGNNKNYNKDYQDYRNNKDHRNYNK